MSSKNMLTAEDLSQIKSKINEVRASKKITNTIIKEDIFRLLEAESVVLYYPIPDENACAFYGQKTDHKDNPVKFTFINTQIPFNKQIFAAGHELAHIWGVSDHFKGEILYDSSISEYTETTKSGIPSENKAENMANRFAAELLVPESALIEELSKICRKGENIAIKHIIDLMDIFVVPFKTIVKRLHEVGKLPFGEFYDELLTTDATSDDSEIKRLQKISGKCLKNSESTRFKGMSDYVQMAIDLYLNDAKTDSKLKEQLKLFDLTLEELGLSKKTKTFLTEDELERILAGENEEI